MDAARGAAGVSVVRPGVAQPRADRSVRRSACRSPRWTPAARATSSHPGVTGLLSADPDGVLARSGAARRRRPAARALGAAARTDAHAPVRGAVGRRAGRAGLPRAAAAAGRVMRMSPPPSRRGRRARGHAAARRRRPRAVGPRPRAASGGPRRRRHAHHAAGLARRRPIGADPFASPRITSCHVPYLTFPFANRRGTTILDRSTAYPLFGRRAGRAAASLVSSGRSRRRPRLRRERARLRARAIAACRRRSCSTRRASRNSARPARRRRG